MYAKLNPDRKTLTPAPRSYGATCNPSAARHLAHGYKLVRPDAPPPAEEGRYVRPTGYDEDATKIWRVYEQVPLPPPPPRVFSKLKVVAALTEAGVWAQVKAWIESKGLYDLYLAAQEFAEGNEYFAQGLAALKPVVGWTDERVEALLAKCVKE